MAETEMCCTAVVASAAGDFVTGYVNQLPADS